MVSSTKASNHYISADFRQNSELFITQVAVKSLQTLIYLDAWAPTNMFLLLFCRSGQ